MALQVKRVREALKRAQRVGRQEEPITVCGCDLVLRSLSPEEHEGVNDDCRELEGVAYMHAFQLGIISRAVVEIAGVDLKDQDFVEVEVPTGNYIVSTTARSVEAAEKAVQALSEIGLRAHMAPPDGDEVRTIKMERHEWLRNEILKDWGREALIVVWRKVTELAALAEQKAKEGVVFLIPEETKEDKYRRILGELREIEEDLPSELAQRILEESGYLKGSTAEEKEAVRLRAQEFALEQAAKEQQEAQEEGSEVLDAQAPLQEEPVPEPPPEPTTSPKDLTAVLQHRRPLNRDNRIPVLSNEVAPVRSEKRPVSPEIRESAVSLAESNRSTQIAQLEGQLDPDLGREVQEFQNSSGPRAKEVIEVSGTAVDAKALRQIIDTPPKAGINPRFRPRF